MSNEYFVADPDPQEIWGFVLDDGEEPPVFCQCQDEANARAVTVTFEGIPNYRKLAKRTLGPVELVED